MPADSFLGVSSVRFGRLKRLRSGSTQLANALLWPPPVPEDSFLGGSSVPFGGLNRLRSGSTLLSLRVLPFSDLENYYINCRWVIRKITSVTYELIYLFILISLAMGYNMLYTIR